MALQPVKLWNTGNAEDLFSPRRVDRELMCQYEKRLPLPKATQILTLGFKESKLEKLAYQDDNNTV